MFVLFRRAVARHACIAPMLLLALCVWPRFASAQVLDAKALELNEVVRLALIQQPILQGLDARMSALRDSAVAARQLPDPTLTVGVSDVPINESDAYSFTRDADTQFVLGVAQEFPRAQKRLLRGELFERDGNRLQAELASNARAIRRDASLAWVDLWHHGRELALMQATLHEAETQTKSVEIALRTNTASQASYLAARVEEQRLQDAVLATEQGISHAQFSLSRWIGNAAFARAQDVLPNMPALPSLEVVLARVTQHPRLQAAQAGIATATSAVALAQAAYKPDWRVEVGYGYRPQYAEMVMLKVGVDLPVFRRDRQDRGLGAALSEQTASMADADDLHRQLQAEVSLNHHDFALLDDRIRHYDEAIIPTSEARTAAAVASWQAGKAQLRDVLDARRAALDVRKARLDLQADLAKHFVQLTYLGAYTSADQASEQTHE